MPPPRIAKPVLIFGEALYWLGLQGIYLLYRMGIFQVHRLRVPVVSVGNLTWGGTGKTPMVMALAQHFQKRGKRVAVLTRGYGQDEARLLTQRLHPIPVLVGADRVALGETAYEKHAADVVLLDDGYQQWRLKKDLDILMVDATSPFGNGRLIPRGTLRELPEAAARADLIVVTRSDLNPDGLKAIQERLRGLNEKAAIFFSHYRAKACWRWPSGEEFPLEGLQEERICALSGIAQPQQFEQTLRHLGGKLALKIRVRDHHPYTIGQIIRLFSRCQRHQIRRIVTTAKDAVRIPDGILDLLGPKMKGMEILVLEVQMEFEPSEKEFHHRIDSLLAR